MEIYKFDLSMDEEMGPRLWRGLAWAAFSNG